MKICMKRTIINLIFAIQLSVKINCFHYEATIKWIFLYLILAQVMLSIYNYKFQKCQYN